MKSAMVSENIIALLAMLFASMVAVLLTGCGHGSEGDEVSSLALEDVAAIYTSAPSIQATATVAEFPYLVIDEDGFFVLSEKLAGPEDWPGRTYAGFVVLDGDFFAGDFATLSFSPEEGRQIGTATVSGVFDAEGGLYLTLMNDGEVTELNLLRDASFSPGVDYTDFAGIWTTILGEDHSVELQILESGQGTGSYNVSCIVDMQLSMFGSNVPWRRAILDVSNCNSDGSTLRLDGVMEVLDAKTDPVTGETRGPYMGIVGLLEGTDYLIYMAGQGL